MRFIKPKEYEQPRAALFGYGGADLPVRPNIPMLIYGPTFRDPALGCRMEAFASRSRVVWKARALLEQPGEGQKARLGKLKSSPETKKTLINEALGIHG